MEADQAFRNPALRALVVFRDFKNAQHPLAFLLKKGFQHCFVCVQSEGFWIQIDGGVGVPFIKAVAAADFDLAAHIRGLGFTVVETNQRQSSVTFPFSIRNCVGLVKTVLCINSWALTPYGLYKYLRKG